MRPNMMVGAICLISAASFAACRPSQSLDAAVTAAEPLKLEAQQPAPAPAAAAAAAKVTVKKAVANTGAKSPAVSNAVASPDATPASTPVMESRAVAANQQDDDAPIAATITGCLVVRDDGMFQLKDNDGEHAPKARSWKSGFIKKGSATVDVFDAGNRLQLMSHINYRVSVSGTLSDRELRARSLSATSAHCD
jgi:hypothetical protein